MLQAGWEVLCYIYYIDMLCFLCTKILLALILLIYSDVRLFVIKMDRKDKQYVNVQSQHPLRVFLIIDYEILEWLEVFQYNLQKITSINEIVDT